MKFEIGKFYKATENFINFEKGAKLICVNYSKDDDSYCFYGDLKMEDDSDAYWENGKDIEAIPFIEPREFDVALARDGRVFDLRCIPEKVEFVPLRVREILI